MNFYDFLYEEHNSNPQTRKIKHDVLKELNSKFDMLKQYEEHKDCSICLETIGKINYYNTQCNHKFHVKCINKWKLKNNNCPICRKSELSKLERIEYRIGDQIDLRIEERIEYRIGLIRDQLNLQIEERQERLEQERLEDHMET